MASLFGKCWNKFVLLAAAVLWVGCSDAEKNADKSLEQEKGNTEQSLDVKKGDDEKARKDSAFKASIDSVLKAIGKVSTRGMTILYGSRPVDGSSICMKIDEDEFPIINEKLIQVRARGFAQTPTYEELSVATRVDADKALILRTIRLRIPGLRHIYNKHLKRNPSFSGTIALRLNINADGSVQKVQIDSTTTGNSVFDEEVQKAAGRWNFQKMNSSVVATFPVKFYEKEPTKLGD